MTDFFRSPDRLSTNSIKWTLFDPDVIPLWVADMDFPAPQPILEAIRAKLDHGVLGYEFPTRQLRQVVADRMNRVHGWQVDPDWVLATPGVIAAFNAAAQAVCQPGQGVLFQTPAYPPFYGVSKNVGLVDQISPLIETGPGQEMHYQVDMQAFRQAIHHEAPTGMFLACNPHNPTGRVFSREELLGMAEACLEKDVVICSDEIHNEHFLDGAKHTVLASLSPEIAARTITLVAPSKTFNVPGLFCAFAIIPDAGLREKFKIATERMLMHVSSLSLIAAEAAFGGACDPWLENLRAYLAGTRDELITALQTDFPEIRYTRPQATYMTWLDCSSLAADGRIAPDPHTFFLNHARVALSKGVDFGAVYTQFTRLLFGCTREMLFEGLKRMKRSLTQ